MKQEKINTNLVPLTASEMYRLQVRNNMDNIRYTNRGMTHIPTQFGGLAGQRSLLSEPSVMEIIDFEVTDDN